MDRDTCARWKAGEDQFDYYMQNLAKFGVFDADESGRAISQQGEWEWRPEGVIPEPLVWQDNA